MELWSSADGRTWSTAGLLSTSPESSLDPFYAPSASGGYLAIGADFQLRVSVTGAEWADADGVAGIGQAISSAGELVNIQVTPDAVFALEGADFQRVVWVFRIQE